MVFHLEGPIPDFWDFFVGGGGGFFVCLVVLGVFLRKSKILFISSILLFFYTINSDVHDLFSGMTTFEGQQKKKKN